MKKRQLFIYPLVVCALGLFSCNSEKTTTPHVHVKLNTQADTLSYAFGAANTQDIKEMLITKAGVDTAYIKDFIRGILDARGIEGTPEQRAYSVGLQMGSQFETMVFPDIEKMSFPASDEKINRDAFYDGFVSVLLQENVIMQKDEAMDYVNETISKIRNTTADERYAENKVAGEAFLQSKKTQKGVFETESGLLYEVIKDGHGSKPVITDKVRVKYVGTLIDGTEFDNSSAQENGFVEFQLKQVIPGWTEGLQLMKEGSVFQFYIPADLAYSDREVGPIKPFSTLIFKIELLEVVK